MATAVFIYNSHSISIPCKENDKMIKIINDFKNKINNHDDKILFFYYDKSIMLIQHLKKLQMIQIN